MTDKEQIIVPNDLFNKLGIRAAQGDQLTLPEARMVSVTGLIETAEKLANSRTAGLMGVYYRARIGENYLYRPASATVSSLPPALNEAYLYLLGTFAGPYSPDLVVTTAEGVAFDKSKDSVGGSHNMINWADQHIPLLIAGPGLKGAQVSYAPARLVDIAPTVARLFGLEMVGMDGVALADALAAPLEDDVSAQQAVNEQIGPLRDALEVSAMR